VRETLYVLPWQESKKDNEERDEVASLREPGRRSLQGRGGDRPGREGGGGGGEKLCAPKGREEGESLLVCGPYDIMIRLGLFICFLELARVPSAHQIKGSKTRGGGATYQKPLVVMSAFQAAYRGALNTFQATDRPHTKINNL
jgi:hypothetical protein